MYVYYITIAAVMILCISADKVNNGGPPISSGGSNKSTTRFLFFFAAIILIFVSSIRYRVGTDYGQYEMDFDYFANGVESHIKSFREPGIYIMCWLIESIGGDYKLMFAAAAVITIGLCMATIYKNTKKLAFAVLLYILLGCWHNSFNGVRQCIACAIIFSGYRYILERKFIKYALVTLAATAFHTSAVFIIILYFVGNNRVSVRNCLLLLAGTLLIAFSYDRMLEMFGWLKGGDPGVSDTYLNSSVNIFRVIAAVAPAVLVLAAHGRQTYTKEETLYTNLLIMHGAMMIATMNSTYLARMSIYTGIFTTISLPNMFRFKDKRMESMLHIVVILCFAYFWYYEVSRTINLREFQFIWNN